MNRSNVPQKGLEKYANPNVPGKRFPNHVFDVDSESESDSDPPPRNEADFFAFLHPPESVNGNSDSESVTSSNVDFSSEVSLILYN